MSNQASSQNAASGSPDPLKPGENQIVPAFPVPLITVHKPNPDAFNRQLTETFLAYEAEGDRYRNPEPFVYRNDALFESNFSLFDWPDPPIQELRKFCLSSLYSAIGELNGYDTSTLQRMHIAVESWFHITRRGGFFGAHNHPNHSWSGVYCVQHDGDDPDTDSGKLTFLNPHMTSTMYIDWATANLKDPFRRSPMMLRLKPGQLVLFPSWLLHEVLPYDGDKLRITVAFNARFRYAGDVQKHQAAAS
jgi:hypothetical protein